VKKLFALFAVAALAAVGCDDKKTSSKTNATTGGTYIQKNTVEERGRATVTDTVVQQTGTVRSTETARVTTTVKDTKPGGPGLPDKNGKDK
jgi:hypothetical protein